MKTKNNNNSAPVITRGDNDLKKRYTERLEALSDTALVNLERNTVREFVIIAKSILLDWLRGKI